MYLPDISTVLLVIGNEELKQILEIPGTVEEHNLEVSLLFSDVIAKLLAFSVRSSETEEAMYVRCSCLEFLYLDSLRISNFSFLA